jgi:hypothetical protein
VDRGCDEAIRAYQDVGMRVSYSYAVRDQNRLVYQRDEDFQRCPVRTGLPRPFLPKASRTSGFPARNRRMRASGMAKNALLMALRRLLLIGPGSERQTGRPLTCDGLTGDAVVVDNGSTDNTAEIIHGWAGAAARSGMPKPVATPRSFPDDIGLERPIFHCARHQTTRAVIHDHWH